jgi:hypothetical protein
MMQTIGVLLAYYVTQAMGAIWGLLDVGGVVGRLSNLSFIERRLFLSRRRI